MAALKEALRFAVLQALERARQRVARGLPSLHAAWHYMRLSDSVWAEVDKAMDTVRFEVPAELLTTAALSEGAKSAEGMRLRDELQAAERNARIPWESPEGLTRGQTVALLFIAQEFLRRLPAVSAGPLLPSLPIYERNDT